MIGSYIYTDFTKEITWIREQVVANTQTLPKHLTHLADHYLSERLLILPDPNRSIRFTPELGRPVPYAAFWFADAFGLRRDITQQLALGLVYSALATTVRDDIVDNEMKGKDDHAELSNRYYQKHLDIFSDVFDSSSPFWGYLAASNDEITRYERWNLRVTPEPHADPLSQSYLTESSRYFSAVVMPTLTAITVLTKNEKEIPNVSRFLRHFSMGWRIVDDLTDWRIDVKQCQYNRSTVLLSALREVGAESKLNEEIMASVLLSNHFVENLYDVMLGYFHKARNDTLLFSTPYLTRFIDEQIHFHTRRKGALLRTSTHFNNKLRQILLRCATRNIPGNKVQLPSAARSQNIIEHSG